MVRVKDQGLPIFCGHPAFLKEFRRLDPATCLSIPLPSVAANPERSSSLPKFRAIFLDRISERRYTSVMWGNPPVDGTWVVSNVERTPRNGQLKAPADNHRKIAG